MFLHKIIQASFLILLKHNKLLLVQRENTGYYDGYLSLISGNVERGETFSAAIIREAEEEVGIILVTEDIKAATVLHRINKDEESINVFFIVSNWHGTLRNAEKNKCDRILWVPINNLPANIIPYVHQGIEDSNMNILFREYVCE